MREKYWPLGGILDALWSLQFKLLATVRLIKQKQKNRRIGFKAKKAKRQLLLIDCAFETKGALQKKGDQKLRFHHPIKISKLQDY